MCSGGHGYDPPRWFGEASLPEDFDDWLKCVADSMVFITAD